MPVPYLFFADIDGTLIRTGTPLSARVKAAAKRFVAAGGMLTLCTGRSHISTAWLVEELEISLPCILFSGAIVYDFSSRRVVEGIPLERADLLPRLRDTLTRFPRIGLMAYTVSRVHLLNGTDFLRRKGLREELEPAVSHLDDVTDDVYKVVMACPDVDMLRACCEEVYGADALYSAFSSTHFAEVVVKGADKGGAARRFAASHAIPMERTFAAGDAMTDLPLFHACGRCFAMRDAPGPMRERALAVVPGCDQDGMEQAFDMAVHLMREDGPPGAYGESTHF